MTKAYDPRSFITQPTDARHEIRRLNMSSVRSGRRGVRWPGFDPRELRPGILHLGCGAFHRAHQNVFTQRAIELEGEARSPWGVLGVSFRRREISRLLTPQDYLYSVLERGSNGTSAEVVAVLKGLLFAREEQDEIVAAIGAPDTRIVTLTVTPSGYSAVPQPDMPVDAIGLLVAGIAVVRSRGTPPPVLISCDNMPRNGNMLREALVQRAALVSATLSDWIARNVQCPCSVVDRIVPVPTSQDRALAGHMLGVDDLAAVATEPFHQWVIEDFEGPRPRWELAGAEFVSDVSPWEASKLNLLNGTHLAIAFLGILSGVETVCEVVQDPLFAEYARRLMHDEQIPTIPRSDHDLATYARSLLERWRNPNMRHQLQRIARNASEKLRPRLLCSLAHNIEAGRPAPCTMLAIAAWVCCVGRLMPFTGPIEDSAAAGLENLASRFEGDSAALIATILCKRDIFGDVLPDNPGFVRELGQAMEDLRRHGARGAVSRIVSTSIGICA
jgi:fructuronate reductase